VPFRMPVAADPQSGLLGGTSVQGASLELRHWLQNRLAIGGLVGWHAFGDRATRTLTDGVVTQTGIVQTEANSNELLARVTYALADRGLLRKRPAEPGQVEPAKKEDFTSRMVPRVSLGAGAARFLTRYDTGLEVQTSERWHVALVPEVAIEVPTQFAPALVAFRLHYLLGSSDGPDQLYGSLSLGLVFE
jgi:hypothetical protein